jgi:hypothetical protein
MEPNERELQVFRNLTEGGEGEILSGYVDKLALKLTEDTIDSRPTQEQIEGLVLMRKFCKQFAQRLQSHGIITPQVERHD